ncbi:MAG: hypothetical protein LBJ35_00085, partial [Spirochaetaceae bacterium]|nr:hypothetical protein [Spirochaetaceae bacterium]
MSSTPPPSAPPFYFTLRRIIYAVLLPFCLSASSCKKSAAVISGRPAYENTLTTKTSDDSDSVYANAKAVKLAFTLDYRAENAEDEAPPDNVMIRDAMARDGAGKNAGTVEIIPGLRKLSDYKTNYTTNTAAQPELDADGA